MMSCALCLAMDENRPGDVVNAGGIPLCFEHNASINEQSRKPKPPRIIGNRSPEQLWVEACVRATLFGTPSPSLANSVKPVNLTLK